MHFYAWRLNRQVAIQIAMLTASALMLIVAVLLVYARVAPPFNEKERPLPRDVHQEVPARRDARPKLALTPLAAPAPGAQVDS
jgi:hypothetical protein